MGCTIMEHGVVWKIYNTKIFKPFFHIGAHNYLQYQTLKYCKPPHNINISLAYYMNRMSIRISIQVNR